MKFDHDEEQKECTASELAMFWGDVNPGAISLMVDRLIPIRFGQGYYPENDLLFQGK